MAGRNKVVYTVRSGDVLGTIAERYSVRVSDIKRWNRMLRFGFKTYGKKLRIGKKNMWVHNNVR